MSRQQWFILALFSAFAMVMFAVLHLIVNHAPLDERTCEALLAYAKSTGEPEDYATHARHCGGGGMQ